MDKLSQEDIDTRLDEFPDWSQTGDSLQRTLSFEDFLSAMAFVNRIAELAERLQHHPDIMIRFNKVTLTLTTHDASGVTENDFAFATDTDSLTAAK